MKAYNQAVFVNYVSMSTDTQLLDVYNELAYVYDV